MQLADDYRERALACLWKDPKAPVDPMAQMWLSLAVLEVQLFFWAAQIEGQSKTPG